MLGAPQAQDDGFDDLEDYGKQDAWRDETDASKFPLSIKKSQRAWEGKVSMRSYMTSLKKL